MQQTISDAPFSQSHGNLDESGNFSMDIGSLSAVGGIALNYIAATFWQAAPWTQVATSDSNEQERAIESRTEMLFWFADPWDFDWNPQYPWYKNITNEVIPGPISDAVAHPEIVNEYIHGLPYKRIGNQGQPFTIRSEFKMELILRTLQFRRP